MSWPVLPLRRLFRVVNGGTPTPDEANWGGEVPWATPVDLGSSGGTIAKTGRTLTSVGARSGSRVVPAGSLLVSTRAPIGYVAQTQVAMAFNQGCRALVPLVPIDVRFFAHQLKALEEVLKAEGQGTTFSELTSEGLAAIGVRVPPLEEQHRIADFLDHEAGKIVSTVLARQRAGEILLSRRRSVIHGAVTRTGLAQRRKSGLAWSPTLPSEWREVKLSLVARMGSGHTPSRSRPDWWLDCTIPWITTGEVALMRDDRREVITETREMVSRLGVENSSAEIRPAGTVVLSRTASAGYSAIMGAKMATSQDFVTWTCGPSLNPHYLLWCLRAMRGDLLGRLAMGSTHKTIYVPDLEMLRIPLPPIDEQAEIVTEIKEQIGKIDIAVDTVRAQMALLQERRRALITAAVAGQIDVSTAQGALT